MQRILGVVGSPRENGNTERLMRRVLVAAQEEGAEAQFFSVAGQVISACQACGHCKEEPLGVCAQRDDMQALYPLLEWAEAVVFGTPVYMNGMSAQMKAVFDRCRPLLWLNQKLAGKVVAVLAVGAGRFGGQEKAADDVLSCAFHNGMVLPRPEPGAPHVYRVCAVGAEAGDVTRDEKAMGQAEKLGRCLAMM
jgi:multimeric flavodoxin WrbA